MIDSNTIPAWLVAINLFLSGFLLRFSFKRGLRVLSTLFIAGNTMILEAIIYFVAFQFFNIETETRVFISRLMLISLCMSLYLPLFVSYLRSRNRVS